MEPNAIEFPEVRAGGPAAYAMRQLEAAAAGWQASREPVAPGHEQIPVVVHLDRRHGGAHRPDARPRRQRRAGYAQSGRESRDEKFAKARPAGTSGW